MNDRLSQRVTALESATGIIDQGPFVLFGDERLPEGCDERKVVRVQWISLDVANARGWR